MVEWLKSKFTLCNLETHVCFLLVNNHLESHGVKDLLFESLDVNFVVIRFGDKKVQVGSYFARLSDKSVFIKMIGCFNAAKHHCSKNRLRGPIVVGDFNAGHREGNDTMSNGYEIFLLVYCGIGGSVV